MEIVNVTLLLQVLYLLFYLLQIRAFIFEKIGLYPVAYIELALSVGSLLVGLIALALKGRAKRLISVIAFGLFLCLMFIVIYLLSEAGIPPALPWLYKEAIYF